MSQMRIPHAAAPQFRVIDWSLISARVVVVVVVAVVVADAVVVVVVILVVTNVTVRAVTVGAFSHCFGAVVAHRRAAGAVSPNAASFTEPCPSTDLALLNGTYLHTFTQGA